MSDFPQARSMTRGETRKFKRDGASFADAMGAEDAIDYILDVVYGGADGRLDEFSNADCMKLAAETIRLTYASEEEVKN